MSAAEVALALFTLCNTVRVAAYLPQIVRIGRDASGAAAISYGTWTMFGFSHLSTVFYALVALGDLVMALVFATNAVSCAAIVALTAWKRRRHPALARTTDERLHRTARGRPPGPHPRLRASPAFPSRPRPRVFHP